MKKDDEAIDIFGCDVGQPASILGSNTCMPEPNCPNEDIIYEEIPLLSDQHGIFRLRGMIKIEPDILQWLISKGRHYEALANNILRREMLLDRAKESALNLCLDKIDSREEDLE